MQAKQREEYEKIFYQYEKQYIKINNTFYKKSLQKLIQLNEIYKEKLTSLYGDNETKFNTMQVEVLKEEKDSFYFYHILKEYKYHIGITILWFISDICDTDYKATEEYLINLYQKSPYIRKIYREKNYFIIDSVIGTFPFQKLSDYIKDLHHAKLERFYEETCIPGYCHYNTKEAVSILAQSSALTALCRASFRGTYYHSFTKHNENCIDFNFNCVMPYEAYKKLVDATIINEIPHHRIEEELYLFQDWEDPLFYKTIDKQIQKKL